MTDTAIIVNGSAIPRFELDFVLHDFAMELYRTPLRQLSPEALADVRQAALEKLVARELIYLAALSEGVLAGPQEVEEALNKAVRDYKDERGFAEALKRAGIDVATYHRILRKEATVALVCKQKREGLPEPTEDELLSAYDKRRQYMVKPATVQVSHILIAFGEDKEAARDEIRLIRRRCETEDFSRVASEVSQCPSSSQGGHLGSMRRRDMAEGFAEVAMTLPVGELSDIVESPFGFHLIKVSERQAEEPLSFDAVRPELLDILQREREAALLQDWVEQLRSTADIRILDPA